jgi:hypothetical protein
MRVRLILSFKYYYIVRCPVMHYEAMHLIQFEILIEKLFLVINLSTILMSV